MPCIDSANSLELTKSVSKEEVSKALNSMMSYKALGIDGFQVIFFKQYLHIVGDDIWNLVKNSFETSYFGPKLAETLVVLIPMVEIIQVILRNFILSSCTTLVTKLLPKSWFIDFVHF